MKHQVPREYNQTQSTTFPPAMQAPTGYPDLFLCKTHFGLFVPLGNKNKFQNFKTLTPWPLKQEREKKASFCFHWISPHISFPGCLRLLAHSSEVGAGSDARPVPPISFLCNILQAWGREHHTNLILYIFMYTYMYTHTDTHTELMLMISAWWKFKSLDCNNY